MSGTEIVFGFILAIMVVFAAAAYIGSIENRDYDITGTIEEKYYDGASRQYIFIVNNSTHEFYIYVNKPDYALYHIGDNYTFRDYRGIKEVNP